MFKKPVFWTLVILFAAVVGWLWWNANENEPQVQRVTNFAECEAAGYPVGESFPRQCFEPNGQTFTEPVDNDDVISQNPQVKVHFSKDPASNDDFDLTVAVNRELGDAEDRIETALIELIKGPTATESESGLFSPITLSGDSNCEGGNFEYSTSSDDKFTFTFCRNVASAGVGDDARIQAVIEATVAANATPTTYEVIILDRNGNCFGDMSGQNLCLN